jgi:hypothetical protein
MTIHCQLAVNICGEKMFCPLEPNHAMNFFMGPSFVVAVAVTLFHE